MKPTVSVRRGGAGAVKVMRSFNDLAKKQVYVGIPTTTAQQRMQDILKIAASASGKRKRRLMAKAVGVLVNNAELLYIHTHGSPLRGIPPRPVLEPAINAAGNKQAIVKELKLAAEQLLKENMVAFNIHLKRAGLLAQNFARAWFTDPRNGWAPNRPSTIRRKGSDKPLIDTGELRKSITYVIGTE